MSQARTLAQFKIAQVEQSGHCERLQLVFASPRPGCCVFRRSSRGGFSEGAGPYQSDPEGESAESPVRAEIDQRLDVADPSSGRDDPVDDRRHAIDGRKRMKLGMLRRPGQDADRYSTDGKPEDDARHDVDPSL